MGSSNSTQSAGQPSQVSQAGSFKMVYKLTKAASKFLGDSGISAIAAEFIKNVLNAGTSVAFSVAEQKARNSPNGKLFMDSLKAEMAKPGSDEATVGGCYEAFAMARAPKAGAAELDSVLAIGGCGCGGLFVGAADMDIAAVKNYSSTVNASAKDTIVENIINALSNMGITPDSSATSSQEKLKSLISKLPATFKSDAAVQSKLIASIAKVLNDSFGQGTIDVGQPADVTAKHILEVMHSLTSGMHTEYLSVYSDVVRTIQNLRVLVGALEDSLKKIDVRVKDQSGRDVTLANLRNAVDLALGEAKRQLAMLESLLNTTLSSADKSIAKLLQNISSTQDIENLARPGDRQFGKTISDILQGMGVTANLTIIINNALKKVGLTVEQYAKTSSVTQLIQEVEARSKDLKDDAETEEFFKAVKTLAANLWRAGEFADRAQSESVQGGADAERYEQTPIQRQIKNRKNIRNLIFTAFNKKIQEAFNRLVSTIDVLSVKIGTDVPVTTELDGFRSSLQRIDNNLIYHKNIYYALIGYYNDALAKSKREEFVAELKVVKTHAELVSAKPEFAASAGLFREVISAVDVIIALIDQYSDEISAKFGSEEHTDPEAGRVASVLGGCDCDEDVAGVLGGADDEDEIVIKPETLNFKSVHTIHDAVTKFDYRFKVAQIRRNLKATSAELEEFNKDYDKTVTNSIYEIVAGEKRKYNALRSQFEESKFGLVNTYTGALPGYTTDDEVNKQKDAALKMLDNMWKAKENFWATIEAADRYMQVFTDALVKNPEDVQDIKSMLDSIEIISDWYTDATGNSASGIFDYFPNRIAGAVPQYPPESYRNGPVHYYKRIGDAYTGAASKLQAAPGNPNLVSDPVNGLGAFNQVKKTFEGLSVLKNLISVFVHVGSKFGGEDLHSKVFMSPSKMYNNLVEYIQASSFAQGFGLASPNDVYKDDLPEYFNDFRRFGPEYVDLSDKTTLLAGAVGPNHVQIGSAATVAVPAPAPGTVRPPVANGADKAEQFRQRWGVWMRSVQDQLVQKEGFGFKMEDEYFVLMLKSLAAKIFTVVGMYEVLDRPYEYNGLSPIRMMIGGAEGDSIPKIDEAVTPLYLRLTLLAQFYRKIFSFTHIGDEEIAGTQYDWEARNGLPRKDKNVKISMVPDVMGTFAGFIRLMFRKVRGIEPDNFSDDDIREIVNEVNIIYGKFKDKYATDVVTGVIQEFVAEVNRRYAIVSKEERNDYESEFGSRYDRLTDGTNDFDISDRDAQMPNDIPLLPGEDETEVNRLAEFQRRLDATPMDDKYKSKSSKFKITSDHQKLVRDFRCSIDKFFEHPDDTTSFDGPIASVVRKLKLEQRDDQRFKLVASLIRGTDAYTKIDGSKYVMFHETVIGQLNVLSSIHSMLSRFKVIVQVTDIKWLEKELVSYLKAAGVAAPFSRSFAIHLANRLVNLGLISSVSDEFAVAIIKKLLGSGSNEVALGGVGGTEYSIKKNASVAAGIDRNTQVGVVGGQIVAGTAHLFGLLNGIPVAQLETDAHATKLQTVFRYAFDREFIMKLLIESLFGLTSDLQGLVQISWDHNKLSVNAGGIKKLVSELFDSVGYFIDALRPQLEKDFINRYTSKTSAGSLYWLQEQLIEKIIDGREGSPDGTKPKYDNIERVMQTLSTTYRELTREWKVNGLGLVVAGQSLVSASNDRDSYDKVLAEVIFYDGSKPESGIAANTFDGAFVSTEPASIVDYVHDPFEALHFMGPQGTQTIDTRYIMRFKQLYGFDDGLTNNKSALFMFNQLVAKFIKSFYDPSSQKMYGPLMNQFANGVFSRSVVDHTFAYPDTVPAWYLKYAAGENVPVSSEYNFRALIRPDEIDRLEQFKGIIRDYLNYKPAGVAGIIPPRPDRFNMAHPDLSRRVVANVIGNVPKIYALLFATVASRAIIALASELVNAGVAGNTAPAAVGYPLVAHDLLRAGQAAVDFNAAMALYGGSATVVPTMDQVMTVLFSNLPGTIDLARAAVAGPPRPIVGALVNYLAAPGANAEVVSLNVLIEAFLNLDDNITGVANNWYTVASVVAGKLPYRLPIGASNIEVDFTSDVFAGMIMALVTKREELQGLYVAAAGNAAEQTRWLQEWNHFVGELFRQNQGSTVYVPPVAVQPKTDVKREDIMGAVSEDFLGAFRAPNMHNDYIMIARAEAVSGALKQGNISTLSGGSGKPGTFRSAHNGPQISSDAKDAVVMFGNRCDPDGEHVLFSSIANVLKSLYQSRNSTQATVFLHDSLADVALYMKEKYRANLPVFKNLFNELRAKCEFTKKLLEQNELNVARDFGVMAPTHNPWPYVLKEPVLADRDVKTRFGGILDTIIQGCNSMVSACDQVLREVSDDPKYLEFYGGSIKDYKSQYGTEPFMPVSSMLRILVNASENSVNDLLPTHSMGEESFKLMYAIRGLFASLQSEPTMENLPGFNVILEQFNALQDPKLQVSKERCEAFLKSFIKGLRFIYEAKHIKGTISPLVGYGRVNALARDLRYKSGLFTKRDLVVTDKQLDGSNRGPGAQTNDPESDRLDVSLTNKSVVSISTLAATNGRRHIKPVFAIAKPLADVIRLTESSDREARIRELVEYLKTDVSGRRNSKEIQNIIDLNIVPINVHALRREIPLINLYNYAYTFDRLIIELYYGLRSDAARKMISELCNSNDLSEISSAKDMLVALLINPYRDFRSADSNHAGSDLWNTHVKGMLVGVGSEAELGRPKFLSDQIYNKAVFGEMYSNELDRNEMGPAAAEIRNRKPTKDTLLQFADILTRHILVSNYLGHVLNNAANINDPALASYVRAAVKMFIENPTTSIRSGASRLAAKARSAGTFGVLTTLGAGATVGERHNNLAYITCLWAKIVLLCGSNMANAVVRSGYSDAKLDEVANISVWLVNAVLGSLPVGVAGVAPIPGVPAAGGVAAVAPIPGRVAAPVAITRDALIAAVKAKLLADAGAGVVYPGAVRVAQLTVSQSALVDSILDKFAEDISIGAGVNAVGVANVLLGGQTLKDAAGSLFELHSTATTIALPAALHWLDLDQNGAVDRDRVQLGGLPNTAESHVRSEDVSLIREALASIGRARFDTKFIRNLIFIVNLFRSVRVKLQRDLTYSRDIIQRSAAITRNPITEFTGNSVDANQSLASTVVWSRY